MTKHRRTTPERFQPAFAGSYLPPLCDAGTDAIGCLNAIADPPAMQVMLSALFAYVLHAAKKQQES